MMNDTNNFFAEIEKFRKNWTWINYNILSTNRDGIRIILAAYFWLDVDPLDCSVKELGEILEYDIGSVSISQLNSLLDSISLGEFDINRKEFNFIKSIQNNMEFGLSNRLYFSPYGRGHNYFYIQKNHCELPGCYLNGESESIAMIVTDNTGLSLDYLDKCFQQLEHPFEGFEDFIECEMGLKKMGSDTRPLTNPPSFVTIAAPIPIWVTTNTYLKDDFFSLELCTHKNWCVEDISVGIVYRAVKTDVTRLSVHLNDFDVKTEGSTRYFNNKMVSDSMYKSSVMVRQSGKSILIKECFDYKPIFGDAKSIIFNYVGPRAVDSFPWKHLEAAIGVMFHLAGFDVVNYGSLGEYNKEDIDVIAYLPNSNKILAIECTERAPDNKDKLQKLSRRIAELREKLQGYSIIPIVVTKAGRESIYTGDIENAKRDGIIVLDESDLQKLYKDVSAGLKGDEVVFSIETGVWKGDRFSLAKMED